MVREQISVPTKEYLDNHYGRCNLLVCTCLKENWLGTLCPHWRATGARNFDELMQQAKEIKRRNDDQHRQRNRQRL